MNICMDISEKDDVKFILEFIAKNLVTDEYSHQEIQIGYNNMDDDEKDSVRSGIVSSCQELSQDYKLLNSFKSR